MQIGNTPENLGEGYARCWQTYLIQALDSSLRGQSKEQQFVNGSVSVSFKAMYKGVAQALPVVGRCEFCSPATVCLAGSAH
jgi:hypothetical protein